MTQKQPVRLAGFAALAMTLMIAACSTPEPAAPPPPPPPPPAPAINLASQLFEEASAWRGYMNRASAISPSSFTDGASVATSLKTGAAYEPEQLLRGAIAYAAVVALQDQTFVSGVRAFAQDPQQRLALAAELRSNPYRVTSLPGADRAAGLVVGALGEEGAKVLTTGRAVKQSAYEIQKQKWSKEFVPDREGRLANVRTLSVTPIRGDIEEVSRMQTASLGGGVAVEPETLGVPAAPPGGHWSPVVVRGLALAALAALGEAGDDQMVALQPMFSDEPSAFCLRMSKLMLYQCLAAAKPHYEDVFCLGQHVLIDTGQCTIKSAGAPMPPEPLPPVMVAASKPAEAKAPAKAKRKAK
ncbi:MAG: hypothetical protein GC145_10505 [Caulobacter sp.]|nr:hypothetical protein [Caulobacter sp.]